MSTQPPIANDGRVPGGGAPAGTNGFTFTCPICRGTLEHNGTAELTCAVDRFSFQRTQGIWRLLSPPDEARYRDFIRDYETVRAAEDRGSSDPAYYRTLPFADLTGRFSDDWRIRATSFRALIERVIEPMERHRTRPLNILDLGAGNGWLSNRLAERGHTVTAVDLIDNDLDGLGAHIHYETLFTLVQAAFDHLPFPDHQFDLVIFNASLHYSTSYSRDLGEALRVLRHDGHVVILDTPVYRSASSGEAMVREREAVFVERFGFPSNAIPSENYLTETRLEDLADELGVEWRTSRPNYGIRWSIRRWKARFRGHREPARFLLIDGKRSSSVRLSSQPRSQTIGKRLVRLKYWLTQRRRYRQLVLERAAGRPLVVLPDVFNPALFHTGEFLVKVLDTIPVATETAVLDMGTGSGIGAVVAASRSATVTAVDINPEAIRCARINALLNHVDDRIELRAGDLFEPVNGQRFDVVLFNPPYFRGDPDDLHDHAWRSKDVVERFARDLPSHLTSAGFALVVLSSDGTPRSFLETFRSNGLDVGVVDRRKLIHETLTVYRLTVKE